MRIPSVSLSSTLMIRSSADDHQPAGPGVDADMNADAAEDALALPLELLVLLGVEVARVRVEPFQAEVDHVLDEFPLALVVELADVIRVDLRQYLGEQSNHLQVFLLRLLRRAVGQGQSYQHQQGHGDEPGQVPTGHESFLNRGRWGRVAGGWWLVARKDSKTVQYPLLSLSFRAASHQPPTTLPHQPPVMTIMPVIRPFGREGIVPVSQNRCNSF
jgi:hypothetical protein